MVLHSSPQMLKSILVYKALHNLVPLLLTFSPATLLFTYSVQSHPASLLVLILLGHTSALEPFIGGRLSPLFFPEFILLTPSPKVFALIPNFVHGAHTEPIVSNCNLPLFALQDPSYLVLLLFHSTHHLTYDTLQLLYLFSVEYPLSLPPQQNP